MADILNGEVTQPPRARPPDARGGKQPRVAHPLSSAASGRQRCAAAQRRSPPIGLGARQAPKPASSARRAAPPAPPTDTGKDRSASHYSRRGAPVLRPHTLPASAVFERRFATHQPRSRHGEAAAATLLTCQRPRRQLERSGPLRAASGRPRAVQTAPGRLFSPRHLPPTSIPREWLSGSTIAPCRRRLPRAPSANARAAKRSHASNSSPGRRSRPPGRPPTPASASTKMQAAERECPTWRRPARDRETRRAALQPFRHPRPLPDTPSAASGVEPCRGTG